LFGVPPSNRHVWWHGMPLFKFDRGKVRDLGCSAMSTN